MTTLSVLYLDEAQDIHVELDVHVSYYRPVIQGVYAGCMEDSFPDEYAEVEYSVEPIEYSHLEDDDWFMDIILDRMQEVYEDDC